MLPEQKADLLKLINSSGFLFQLRIEDEITKTNVTHHKTVIAREHKWVDKISGNEGFIDLIVSTGTNGKIVIECKRSIDATWFFLVPNDAVSVKRANILWSCKLEDNRQVAGWDEMNLEPESIESSFCIVRGQGEKDAPMLERISGVLLQSTECLCSEEQSYSHLMGIRGVKFYFPVIVTTAKLKVCKCDFSTIDLANGQIPDAIFEDVPFVRFTKSMSTILSSSNPPKTLIESAKEGQRTVFVINADALSSTLLAKWEFDAPNGNTPWPWDSPYWRGAD